MTRSRRANITEVIKLAPEPLVRKTTICQFKNGKADISQQFFAKNLFLNVKALGIRFSPVFLKVPYFLELEILYELGRGAYSHIPNPKEGQKFPPLASSRRESMKVVYGCPQLWSCKGSSINRVVKILGIFDPSSPHRGHFY